MRFLLSRLAQAVLVMLAVALLAFGLFRFIGDPVAGLVGQEAGAEERAALRAELGLDDPAPVQFARFIGRALGGDFGVSYRLQRPVAALIAERLPATLELVAVSAVIAIGLGIPLGLYTAIRRGGWLARALMAVSLIGVSLPTFVIGIGLIYLFSVTLDWLPSFGRGPTTAIGWWSTGLLSVEGWKAIVLPAVTLALFQMTMIMRLVRAAMLEVLRTDFIRFARARGIPKRRLYFRHALKNALLPVITIIGLNIGALIGFSIVTETVFQWPGMGLLFVQAVAVADVPILSAYLVLVAFVFVTINVIVDALYLAVDPRLRGAQGGSGR
jgi:peptide/nickel transport system permease protein